MADDVKRTWVGGQLDEPVHTALLKLATHMGKHPSVVIEYAVEDFIVKRNNEMIENNEFIDDKLMVTALALEDRARQNQLTQLKQLAYSHMQFPTEESAERLEAACNASGVSVETLMEEISENQHIAELVSENGSMGNAEMWLLENMRPEVKYPMRNIMDKAVNQGFKEHTIKAAKLKLGIQSVRESKEWVWVLPEGELRAEKWPNAGDDRIVF